VVSIAAPGGCPGGPRDRCAGLRRGRTPRTSPRAGLGVQAAGVPPARAGGGGARPRRRRGGGAGRATRRRQGLRWRRSRRERGGGRRPEGRGGGRRAGSDERPLRRARARAVPRLSPESVPGHQATTAQWPRPRPPRRRARPPRARRGGPCGRAPARRADRCAAGPPAAWPTAGPRPRSGPRRRPRSRPAGGAVRRSARASRHRPRRSRSCACVAYARFNSMIVADRAHAFAASPRRPSPRRNREPSRPEAIPRDAAPRKLHRHGAGVVPLPVRRRDDPNVPPPAPLAVPPSFQKRLAVVG
jgi:hypothetical protein